MPRALLTLLLLLAPARALRAQEPEPPPEEPGKASEESFDAGYARVLDLVEARRWKEAYDGFQALFAAHEDAPYVIERLIAIEIDLKRSAFWRSHAEPRLDDVLDAEVLTWNRSNGALRLRADPEHLGDFQRHDSEQGTLYELPAELASAWTATLRGASGMLAQAQIHALIDAPGKGYVFSVGHLAPGASTYSQHTLIQVEDGVDEAVATVDPAPADPAQPCEVVLDVSARLVRVLVDGAVVCEEVRDDGLGFGRMAFAVKGGFESIELVGRAESGWIDGLLDGAAQSARSAFEREWDPAAHMPAWLAAAARANAALPDPGPFPMPPFDLRVAQHPRTAEHLQQAQEFFAQGRLDEALAYVRGLGADEIEPTVRAFLECFTLHLCDRPRAAFEAGGKLWSEQAGSLTARYLEAVLQVEQKREEEAVAGLRRLTEERPDVWQPWYALTSVLLMLNRPDEARAALDLGQEKAADASQLSRLEGRLVLLFKGPGWRREYTATAGHFVVRSDTDVYTCQRVARECAAAWRVYERQLGPARMPAGATVPVFLFAGEASYRAYAEDALSADAQHTAGLFDRTLQAILVWNAPAHETLQTTLRHEVLHQYLDARLGAIPTWLNEGLAEYYEIAEEERGLPVLGAPHRDHALVLAGTSATPDLEDLVRRAPRDFYRSTDQSYAWSWALVHFLRETTPARKQVFDGLWKRLEQREDNESALDGAFTGVDWDAWNAELAQHVRGLSPAAR